eukprot:UN11134
MTERLIDAQMSKVDWTQRTDFTTIEFVGYEIADGTIVKADIIRRTENKIFISFAIGYQWIDIPNSKIRPPNSIQNHNYSVPNISDINDANESPDRKVKLPNCTDCGKIFANEKLLIYKRCQLCISKKVAEIYLHAIKSVYSSIFNFSMDVVMLIVDFTPKIICMDCNRSMDCDYDAQNINDVDDPGDGQENEYPKFRCKKCDDRDVEYWCGKAYGRILSE